MLRPADGAGCGGERQTRGERFQSTRSTENSIRASGPCRRGQASPGAAGRLRASRWSGGRGRVRLRSSVAMRGSRACRASADEALQPRGARTATLAPGKVPPGNRDGASPLGAVEQWGWRQARARSTRALARPATRGDRGRLPRVSARGQGLGPHARAHGACGGSCSASRRRAPWLAPQLPVAQCGREKLQSRPCTLRARGRGAPAPAPPLQTAQLGASSLQGRPWGPLANGRLPRLSPQAHPLDLLRGALVPKPPRHPRAVVPGRQVGPLPRVPHGPPKPSRPPKPHSQGLTMLPTSA